MKELNFNRHSEPEEAPVVQKTAVRSQGSKAAPTMRTYGRDVEEMMAEEHITKTQVIMAEADRREDRGEARTAVDDDSSHLTQIIIVLVVVLAIGLGIGAYVLIGTKPTVVEDESGEVRVEKTKRMLEISITESPREQILSDTAVGYSKTTFTPNESRVIAFTLGGKEQRSRDATAAELLSGLATTQIPETLLRSLAPVVSLTVEGRTISDPLVGYLSLRTNSYPNSVSGMIEWEEVLASDLIPLLDPKFARTRLAELRGRTWTDKRILGIDARILQDADGNIVIAYAFIEKTRIIIAGNDTVLKSAIEQINTKNQQ